MSAFGAAATANTNPNKSIEVIPFLQMFLVLFFVLNSRPHLCVLLAYNDFLRMNF